MLELFKNYHKFPKEAGVYRITTTHNGLSYIGSAVSLKKRMKDHRNDLKRNDCHVDRVQNVYNKHGESVFEVEFLKIYDRVFHINSPEYNLLLQEEEKFIQELNPRYNTIKTPTTQVNNPAISKKVYQYTMDGDFIREWPSSRSVMRELEIQPQNGLRAGTTSRSSGGFQWLYEKKEKLPKYKGNQGVNMIVQVSTYTLEGKRIKTYPSMSDCVRELFPGRAFSKVFGSIRHACKSTKSFGGLRYAYGDNDSIDNLRNRLHKKGSLVVQYDLQMKPIKVWETSGQAQRKLRLTSINDNISGKTKQCGGFIWKKL